MEVDRTRPLKAPGSTTIRSSWFMGTRLNSMRWNEVVKLLSEIWRIKSTAPQASDHQEAEQHAADAQQLLQENMVDRTKKGNVKGVFTGRSPRQAALKAGNRATLTSSYGSGHKEGARIHRWLVAAWLEKALGIEVLTDRNMQL